jgi:cation-transporting ATPase 13A2
MKVFTVKREEIEKDLNFLGFLVMMNKLKPVTEDIINKLQTAQIKTLMVTGIFFNFQNLFK